MKEFFESVRPTLFHGRLAQSQVDGMNAILAAWAQHGDGEMRHLAYALATAYHETGGHMVPVREGFARNDAGARKVVAGRRYGKPINGHVYYGRGLVQLTWLANYARARDEYGVDLVNNPDLALQPELSARMLIDGLLDGRYNPKGHGLGHYLRGDPPDLKGARMTVNLTDKWELIAGYYGSFLRALERAGMQDQPEMDDPLIRLVEWRAKAPADVARIAKWLEEMPA